MGPDEMAEMVVMARRHYLEGASRVDIARERGVSRFRVGRVLQRAIDTGVLRISIQGPVDVDVDVSEALRRRYGLRRAFAVTTEDEVAVHDAIGRVAGRLLAEVVTEDDVLGMDCGRTLHAMTEHLQGIARCEIVQLTGMAGVVGETSVDICRDVHQVTGGPLSTLFAPIVVPDARTRQALMAQPSIRDTVARYPAVTRAVVAVGAWGDGLSQARELVAPAHREELARAGVVGETCALLFDARGRAVRALEDRRLGISAAELARVPDVIALAGGRGKTRAVDAVLRTGLVGSVVTDVHLARRLLAGLAGGR